MAKLTTKVLTSVEELESLRAAWTRLWESDPLRKPFTSFGWVAASCRTFARHRQLFTIVVTEGGATVGILPLSVADNAIRFLSEPRSDYNDMICGPGTRQDVVEAALHEVARCPFPWQTCTLDNLPCESHLYRATRNLRDEMRRRLLVAYQADCPRVDFAGRKSELLREFLRKKSLRRHANKLGRRGEVAFRHVEERSEIKALLPDFFRQHIARRALAGDRSLFTEAACRDFYYALVDECDPTRELRFASLEVDGRPVAFHFGFEVNREFVWYKPAFSIEHLDCSPGEVLLKRLFEYVGQRDVEVFDFTVGNEGFKSRFATDVNRNYRICLYPRGVRGALNRTWHLAKRRVKAHSRLHGAITSCGGAITRLSESFTSAMKRHGVLRLCAKAALRVWRAAFYATDEVIVFANRRRCAETQESGLEILPGTLTDLACMSSQYGAFLTPGKLRRAKEKLARGDKPQLAHVDGKVVHIAWTGVRESISDPGEVGPACEVPLGQSCAVIADCWTPPEMRGQGIYKAVLRRLVRDHADESAGVWIWCRSDNHASRRAIEQVGFRRQFVMRRTRLFGTMTFSRVSAAVQPDASPAEAVTESQSRAN